MAECEMKTMTDKRGEAGRSHTERQPCSTMHEQGISVDLPAEVQQEIDDLCYFIPEVTNHFTIIDKIGEGTFSSVFLARLKHHPDIKELFALKHIIPTSHPNRILGELTCLKLIGGAENVMGLELCLRNKDHIVIVMRYFPHQKFQDYFNTFDVSDVRDYMKNLLIALRRVHQLDIIHRDIKPSNFLHNTQTKQYSLVDFGLAHDAPVKLYEANKGRAPIVKDHRLHAAQKENVKRGVSTAAKTPAGAAGDQDGSAAGHVTQPGSVRMPLSPLRACTVSPRKASAHCETSSAEGDVSPCPSDKTGERTPSLLPPPPPPGSKGRLSRSHRSVAAEGLGADSCKRVSHSPRRTVLQRTLLSGDEMRKRKDGSRSLLHSSPGKRAAHRLGSLATCDCYGRPIICTICNSRSVQSAQRAGTPGFRAPEVLMKHPQQSTAVDMWAAGVILLSLLSGRYPFFRGNDDLMCLSQIISLLGTESVQLAASSFDKLLTCRPVTRPLDLRSLCQRLRASPESSSEKHTTNPTKQWPEMPESAVDLLTRLLDPNPTTRITAQEALSHSFFMEK